MAARTYRVQKNQKAQPPQNPTSSASRTAAAPRKMADATASPTQRKLFGSPDGGGRRPNAKADDGADDGDQTPPPPITVTPTADEAAPPSGFAGDGGGDDAAPTKGPVAPRDLQIPPGPNGLPFDLLSASAPAAASSSAAALRGSLSARAGKGNLLSVDVDGHGTPRGRSNTFSSAGFFFFLVFFLHCGC